MGKTALGSHELCSRIADAMGLQGLRVTSFTLTCDINDAVRINFETLVDEQQLVRVADAIDEVQEP